MRISVIAASLALTAAHSLGAQLPSWPEGNDGRSPGDRALLGAAVGAGAGFILGAILPSERWRRVRLP